MNLEWVSNAPKNPETHFARLNQSQDDAKKEHNIWASQFIQGDPKATKNYSVSQLKNMGMIGLYKITN